MEHCNYFCKNEKKNISKNNNCHGIFFCTFIKNIKNITNSDEFSHPWNLKFKKRNFSTFFLPIGHWLKIESYVSRIWYCKKKKKNKIVYIYSRYISLNNFVTLFCIMLAANRFGWSRLILCIPKPRTWTKFAKRIHFLPRNITHIFIWVYVQVSTWQVLRSLKKKECRNFRMH